MSTPILFQNKTQKAAYFPGLWYSLETGQPHTSNITIKNQLPSPPPVFLRAGYILFLNEPKPRTSYLNSDFRLKIGFEEDATGNYRAQGFIMSVQQYESNSVIERCLKNGCFYIILATKKKEEQAVTINWSYEGEPGLGMRILVVAVECYFPDGTVMVSMENVMMGIQGNGQNSLWLSKKAHVVA